MIILDTNVVSEPLRSEANPHVVAWLNRQAKGTLYLTSISLAELFLGVELLPKGKRRDGLRIALGEVVEEWFEGRILPFDRNAALAYSTLLAAARTKGRPVPFADAQIAAIAHVHGFSIATRDTSPFAALGVSVINPWK